MLLPTFLIAASIAVATILVTDPAGYYLPDNGIASLSSFHLSNDFPSGSSCGVSDYPNNKPLSYHAGDGPGYLYAAINQLAFGANPNIEGGGGPGGACGVCYEVTPRDSSGTLLDSNSLIFMIVDECSVNTVNSTDDCNACSVTSPNAAGKLWHFHIAVDVMDADQIKQFYNGANGTHQWANASFQKTACGVDNPSPPIKSWGCLSNCKNNNKGSVCATSPAPSSKTSTQSVVVVTETVTKTSSASKHTSTVTVTVTVS